MSIIQKNALGIIAAIALLMVFMDGVSTHSVQLTFELPDNEVQCFYEQISKDTNTVVEFQVVTGGNYDVDMTFKSPSGKVLYSDKKKQYDSFRHQTVEEGVYEVCFSNEFSTFTHKVVYIDWQVGEEAPLLSPSSPERAMTFMETSAQAIHEKLNQIIDDQTHYRLRETQGRAHAEDLNERVQIWSISEVVIIVLVGALQISIIRGFFKSRK